MKLPIILPLSHDSIAVGEDGPTHQPIEQFAMLRSIPNMHVIRPGDAVEMAAAWKLAIESTENPTALILTRQNVETMENSSVEGVSKGAYVIGKEENHLDAIIIASGSEVNLAMKAKKVLLEKVLMYVLYLCHAKKSLINKMNNTKKLFYQMQCVNVYQ